LLTLRSDARLARAAARGDERAFATIFKRYHQELYRFCRALLNDPDEAQDALQATMVSALHGLPGEERRIELRPWLYRVARNEAITIIRRRQETRPIDEVWLAPQPSSEAAFEARERMRALVKDLRALPERQRSALVMRELSGLSYDEIAVALEATGHAARQVVYEARLALQDLEEGRAMSCGDVRRAVSDGDGRVLRGRRLRAHLRGCDDCESFQTAIATRKTDLQAIAPPIPVVAASGLLASLTGGSVGTAGGLFAGGVGLKVAGLIAATAAIGTGAGTVVGVEVPFGSGDEPATESRPAATAPGDGTGTGGGTGEGNGTGAAAGGDRSGAGERGKDTGQRTGRGHGRGGVNGAPQGAEGSAAGGAAAAAPAGTGQPDTPPGSDVASERSNGHSTSPTTGPPDKAENALPDLPGQAGVGGSSTHGKRLK
jgi:RNA polymerase sigma factor (sigma-70 family)